MNLDFDRWISRCRNPRVIKNARGVLVPVSCGKCSDCLATKSRRYASLCCQESSEHKKTFFITLTYDDMNAPVVKLVEHKWEYPQKEKLVLFPNGNGSYSYKNVSSTYPTESYIDYVDVTCRKVHPRNPECQTYRKSINYGKSINRQKCSFKNKLFIKFRRKFYKKSNLFKRRKFPHLYVLKKDDLQNFIKRLRFHISKDFGSEIRYFAVGEYSPKHFRPHYHVLLYVDDERLYPILEDYVNKCWQYGLSYTKPAITVQGVARYVSSYSNSFIKLPKFLAGKQISPFTLHSRFFGVQTNAEVTNTILSFDRYSFESFDLQISTGIRTISLTSSLQYYIFPRCYDYGNKDASTRIKLYTAYQRFKSIYNTDKPSDLVRYILMNPFKRHSIWLLKELEMVPLYDFQPAVFYDIIECGISLDSLDGGCDKYVTYYNRLYIALLISKRFYENTQLPYFDGMTQDKRNRIMYAKIEDFLHQKMQFELKVQYEMQERYVEMYRDIDFKLFYPIDLKFTDNDKALTCLYQHIYNNCDFIKSINSAKDIQYHNRVKHKYLNDANDIFCN